MIIKENFLNDKELKEILLFDKNNKENAEIKSKHIEKLNKEINGWSVLCNFSKTKECNQISKFQGDFTQTEEMPVVFKEISNKISSTLKIKDNHIFCQYISIGENGKVASHYDVGIPGFITYKCNICVMGPKEDVLTVAKENHIIKPNDLYCFEANFFKHHLKENTQARIHISYGFLLEYKDLNWKEDSPRVKLSNRIWNNLVST